MPKLAITNFSKGEFGPELYGRVDVPQYSAGVKEMRNFIIQRYGGAQYRPGFQFVGEVDDASEFQALVPFQYSIDQAYVLALADQKMRVVAEGGFILEDDLKILSITKGITTEIEVPYHGWEEGDRLFLRGNGSVIEFVNRFATVLSVVNDSRVVINIDSRNAADLVASTGTVRTELPPPPPDPEAVPTPVPSTSDGPSTGTSTYDPTGDASDLGPGTFARQNPAKPALD